MAHDTAAAGEKWIGILQPAYLPWLGFFEQLDRVDLFVLLDHVQYTRRDWRSRNRILTHDGPIWLTVPVKKPPGGSMLGQTIREAEVDGEQPWARRHLRSIELAYSRAPFFDRYFPELEELYGRPFRYLAELDEALRVLLCRWLGIATPVVSSSELGVTSAKGELILDLCLETGATDYYSGAAARSYLDADRFAEHGVRVWYQGYQHPTYPQLHGDDFVSHLSVLDLLMNVGPESLEVIRAGGRVERG